jgi:hypothetical protein
LLNGESSIKGIEFFAADQIRQLITISTRHLTITMHILLILSFVIAAKSASGALNYTSSAKACQYFKTLYPNSTYFPNETLYTEANDGQ